MRLWIYQAIIALLFSNCGSAIELRVGTLNCYLLFDPAVDHNGSLDDKMRMTAEEYRSKVQNLATLIKGYNIVALQEIGGQVEIEALAKASGMSWLWSRGRDTATGQEVGFLYNMEGWTVTSSGRASDLDKILSKHLVMRAEKAGLKMAVLVVHLLRPIGQQAERQARQIDAVGAWAKGIIAGDPKTVVVVAGDTNSTKSPRETSIFGVGREAGEMSRFPATHLVGGGFDRLVVVGDAKWQSFHITRPPYGSRPSEVTKRLWSDHYLVGATLAFTDSVQ